MSEDKPSELIKAVAEVAKAVPVYGDAVQPGAKQVGKALETVGRAVNVALMPIKSLVWGAERLEAFVSSRVAAKLERTPPEYIVTPKANVVAPALEALRFTEDDSDLQELYANLIATAMDERVAQRVFPSFVEIMKQLTSDEAKLLQFLKPGVPAPVVHIRRENNDPTKGGTIVARNLSLIGLKANCKYPKLIQTYLDNLDRLGLIEIFSVGTEYSLSKLYDEVEADPDIVALKNSHFGPQHRGVFVRSGLEFTSLGADFRRACVMPYEQRAAPTSEPTNI